MDLTLTVIEAPLDANMLNHTKAFRTEGGTFGRSDSNNWVLPDNDRVISSKHAQIVFKDGRYVLIDTSTNGTFINEEESPIGAGGERALENGDVIVAGQYKLSVRVESSQPVLPKGIEAADFLDSSDKTTFNAATQAKLQAATEAKGLDDWLEPGQPAAAAAAAPEASPEPSSWGTVNSNSPAQPATLTPVNNDPFAVLDNHERSGIGGLNNDPMAAFEQANSPANTPSAWDSDDDDWWKSGSEADNAPATSHSMQEPVATQPIQPIQHEPVPPQNIAPPPTAMTPPPAAEAPFAPHDSASIQPSNIDDILGMNSATAPVTNTPQHTAGQFNPEPPVERPITSEPPPQATNLQQPPAFEQAPAQQHTPVAPMHTAQQSPPLQQAVQQASTPSADITGLAAALGLDNLQSQKLAQLAPEAAAIINETATRLIDLLRARSSIKNELRVQRTMIETTDNNPLKFSASAQDALRTMFNADNQAFMRPRDAVRDSFDDLSDHQVAVLSGMRAAYDAMLKHFAPDKLASRFNNAGNLLVNKKAKNWESYEQYYAKLLQDNESTYNLLFGEDFAITYEKQLAELKTARSLTHPKNH